MDKKTHNRQVLATMAIFSLTSLVFFLVFALARDSLGASIKGFVTVLCLPAQMTMDYFKYATVGGTFLNVGLVGFGCMLVFSLSGAKLNGGSLMAFFLTIGFSFFGMNFLNIWPCILGTWLFTLCTKTPFAAEANTAIFSTALAPFVSEMFWRYPLLEGNVPGRIAAGIGVGVFVGFFMPILCKHGPNMHKGHTLYNAASGAGLLAILLYSFLFKALGVEGPTNTDLGDSIPLAVNGYALVTGLLCMGIGAYLNGKSFQHAGDIFRKSGYQAEMTSVSPALAMINIGIFELFMTAYYNLIGSSMTGPTLAAIICMLSVAASGTHVLNMIPIILGYALAASFCSFQLTTQAIILGLCYASALGPIAGGFGPLAGIGAGLVHAILVTQVVTFYNAFCFYNGGFTCFLTAVIYGTILDFFFERDLKFHWNPIPLLKKKA